MKLFIVPSWYATEDKPLCGSFFAEQAGALIRAGHEVHLLYPDLRFRLSGLRTGVFPLPEGGVPGFLCRRRSLTPFWARGRVPQLSHMLETLYRRAEKEWGRPDLIHLHSCRLGIETAALCKRHRLPLVYTEHYSALMAPPRGLLLEQLTKTLEYADAAIAVSRALQERMQAFRMDTRYLPNFVDTARFVPASAPHEGFVFGAMGNLIPRKRMDLLLRAFARADLPHAFLLIGGDGSEKESLERLAVRLRIEKRVRFAGAVKRKDAPAFYAGCDVLASASEAETFGVTLIEALSCGVPVLATKSGGPESIVVPGRNGLLVPVGDERALAEAMRRMAGEWYDAAALRADCVARFGERAVVGMLEEVYQKTVTGCLSGRFSEKEERE